MHELWLSLGWYWPAAQFVHALPPPPLVTNCPAPHSTQSVRSLLTVSSQLSHELWPALGW